MMTMTHLEALRDPELEVELELKLCEEPEPAGEPKGEIALEIIDDLDAEWFTNGAAATGDVYEIDPIHPLRRLSAWVRGRLAA
jgi:hypothetical protein